MGKRKDVFVSESHLIRQVHEELQYLQLMCQQYDGGTLFAVFKMATACYNIVAGDDKNGRNKIAKSLRNKVTYNTCKEKVSNTPQEIALPMVPTKLVMFTWSQVPPKFSFIPRFDYPDDELVYCNFVEWWNRDIIYHTVDSPLVRRVKVITASPYNESVMEKSTYTRREFVWDMRNFGGAHFDEKINEDLDILLGRSGLNFDFAVQIENGATLSVYDGTLPLLIPAAAAMMRQISHELLVAYKEFLELGRLA